MTPERFEKIKDVLTKRQTDLTVIMDNIHKPHNFNVTNIPNLLSTPIVFCKIKTVKNPSFHIYFSQRSTINRAIRPKKGMP